MSDKTIIPLDVPLKEGKRIYLENHPNKKTCKAMFAARKGKAVKAEDFTDLCKQVGI